MKMAATASYNAVPSMLMVAPTGSTNLVTLLSMWLFSSRHLKVTGSVAELQGKREEIRKIKVARITKKQLPLTSKARTNFCEGSYFA